MKYDNIVVKYDGAVFDLLTALIDSWPLWKDVAGSPDDGMKWRRRYLEITYGCGAYRPYEILVREAARDVGLSERPGALGVRRARRPSGRHAGLLAQSRRSAAARRSRPDRLERSLDKLTDLFAGA